MDTQAKDKVCPPVCAKTEAAPPVTLVYIGHEVVRLPCGPTTGDEFFETLWRQTGADVPGEETEFRCSCGALHQIKIAEQD